MKNILQTLLIFLALFIVAQGSYAKELITERDSKTQELKAGAAGCSAGAGFAFLEINNIRARINTGGDMWWNFDAAQYYVPAQSLKTSMFSASLWIGGLDVNGQLKLAGQRYRGNGDDYWPGVLTVDGSASVDEETCSQYDQLFKMTRAEVDEYLSWWNSANRTEEFPDYTIPQSILDWPAHGDVSKGQSYYLAPFYDQNGDGDYDPNVGDYPYYDVDNSLCRTLTPTMDAEYYYPDDPDNWKYGILSDQVIKGDQTLWWVFNDKGNVHTETEGAPIGMELRGQAFGFATNDEINNMTFYSYEIINRSTFTLTNTYFSQWVDTDLGFAGDDFVGCDVARGLGYCYNGVSIDGTGQPEAYGIQPPAIGVDFFQGPYMDPDGLDNPKYQFVIDPATGDTIDRIQICDVSINGINFGDGIVDNERYGMRRFVYHDNCGGGPTCDPQIAPEYYNFLRGIWKDNTIMQYGGNAHFPDADGPETDFMFPDDTDPCNWATGGIPPNAGWNQNGKYWNERTANNTPFDRRFMQSAGPFDLLPGAVNYITVGIPWAQATSGGPWASVQLLRVVDDKCQALFDNCFKVLDGPDAPDLTFLELDREFIVYISNRRGSNNYRESYSEIDPNIQLSDTIPEPIRDSLRTYNFEGYQIFQLRYADASPESLHDPDVARLVAQFDIKNGVTKLVNYYYNQAIGGNVPVIEVIGGDEGISHSFTLTEDAFADKDPKVVNHKQYYFMVLAYAFNEYQPYSQEPGVVNGLYGQKKPYLAGRKNIKVYTAIPHKNVNGITVNSDYGDGFAVTRLQGQGNGGLELEMKPESIDVVMSKPPASDDNVYGDDNYPIVYSPEYEVGLGPLDVKVVDPLNVQAGEFILKFINVTTSTTDSIKISNAKWVLSDEAGNEYYSDTTINIRNEQIIPELGISINVDKIGYPGDSISVNNGFINSSITYTDSSQFWFDGVPDVDVPGSPFNWIRSGIYKDDANTRFNDWDMAGDNPWDALQYYEKMINGTWSPYCMTAANDQINIGPAFNKISKSTSVLGGLASVNVVITSDKSKWTRCPVIEMCPDPLLAEGGAGQYTLRRSPSIDKDGNFAEENALPSDSPNDPSYINGTGMGWFPGYVINIETGERLNVMYSENSWLSGENGRDMQWNPTPNMFDQQFNILFGGMHYLYVMKHIDLKYGENVYQYPAYDAGKVIRDSLTGTLPAILNLTSLYSSTMYVNLPLASADEEWLPEGNDATIKIRISKPYERYFSTALDSLSDRNQNNFNPMYSFNTEGSETGSFSSAKNDSDLDLINVVPNPYYAYADGPGYERNQLDTRVKITNLPQKCVVTIYSVGGTLIRQYNVDKAGLNNPRGSTNGIITETMTSIDWDLKNHAGIPIAGGLYLIHVKESGGRSGERVIKWFGAMRPIDVNTF